MALLTRIEEIISIPLELFHQRKGFHPVDLNRMALRCMEQGTRKGIRQIYAPNAFTVLLSPADYRELSPFQDTIRADIKGELRRVAEERNYLLAGDLSVALVSDEETPAGVPQVNGVMQGKDEPMSTVLLADVEKPATPLTDNTRRDAPTVILVPAEEQAVDDPVAEGISFLREGQVKAAAERLADAGPEKVDTPQFLAAMAVAMELLGNASQAGRFYRRLQEVDEPRPEVQRRIDYLSDASSRYTAGDTIHGEVGRIELGDTGACIHFGTGTFQLHNPLNDLTVQVNGSVHQHCQLKEGDKIRVGDFEMIYRNTHGQKTKLQT